MKKPSAQASSESEAHSTLLDEALDCCRNIETLAGLLQRTGLYPGAEPVNPLMVANSGYLIGREVEFLRQSLGHLHERADKLGGKRSGKH